MKLNDEYLFRQIAGENVFIPISGEAAKQSKLIAVNETAAQIVNYIKDGLEIPQIAARMSEAYPEVDEEEIRQDVEETVASLVDCGVLFA